MAYALYVILFAVVGIFISPVLSEFLGKEQEKLAKWLDEKMAFFEPLWNFYKNAIEGLFKKYGTAWENLNGIDFFTWLFQAGLSGVISLALMLLSAMLLYVALHLVLPAEHYVSLPYVHLKVDFLTFVTALFIALMEGILGLFLFHGEGRVPKVKTCELRRRNPIAFWPTVFIALSEGLLAGIRTYVYSADVLSSAPLILRQVLPPMMAFVIFLVGIVTPLSLALFCHAAAISFLSSNVGSLLYSILFLTASSALAVVWGAALLILWTASRSVSLLIIVISQSAVFVCECFSLIARSLVNLIVRKGRNESLRGTE